MYSTGQSRVGFLVSPTRLTLKPQQKENLFMAWNLYKSGTVAQVQAAVNALNATDQSAASNAQLVRAKAIMLAEIAAVGGTYLQIQANGAFLDGNSSVDVTVGPVPFVNASGEPVGEESPNPSP